MHPNMQHFTHWPRENWVNTSVHLSAGINMCCECLDCVGITPTCILIQVHMHTLDPANQTTSRGSQRWIIKNQYMLFPVTCASKSKTPVEQTCRMQLRQSDLYKDGLQSETFAYITACPGPSPDSSIPRQSRSITSSPLHQLHKCKGHTKRYAETSLMGKLCCSICPMYSRQWGALTLCQYCCCSFANTTYHINWCSSYSTSQAPALSKHPSAPVGLVYACR